MTELIEQLWRLYGDVLVAFAISLPFAAAVIGALTSRRRRRGVTPAFRLSLAEIGAAVGTAPWIWMTFRPDPDRQRAINLIPLRDLLTVDPGDLPRQVIGNLLVFAALGFFLPMRWSAFASIGRVLAVAAIGSLLIEVLQYVLDIGRVASVDDVLLNTLGAGLAALLSRRWWLRRVPEELTQPASARPGPAG